MIHGKICVSMQHFLHGLLMLRNSMAACLSICLLTACVGCGVQQEKQGKDAGRVATGAALYTDEEAVQNQLKVMAQHAKVWRSAEDGGPSGSVRYAVTDLDQNGRWEILAECFEMDEEREERCVYLEAYEISASGDGMEKIAVDREAMYPEEYGSMEDIMESIHTAYCDPKSGEYHYILRREAYYNAASEEYDYILPGWLDEKEASIPEREFYEVMAVLTLNKGQIIRESQGVQSIDMQERVRSYRGTEAYIDANEYSREQWRDAVYADCGKMDVRIKPFSFDHSLENMTEEQMVYAMKKSYQGFYMGYPLEHQEMQVSGHSVYIPQYTTMQDIEKQNRLNEMIREEIERILNDNFDMQDPEFDFQGRGITVEYAGRDRVSLLLQAYGYRTGAAHGFTYFDTVTIDLEEERILSGQDILPEKNRTEVEEEILEGDCDDILFGEAYRKSREKTGSLFDSLEDWQYVKFYQTWDDIGVVLQSGYSMDPYIIYEVGSDRIWDENKDKDEDERGVYSDVDWEAYQYKLLPEEYQRLQDFMPVLTGQKDFSWLKKEYYGEDDKDNIKTVKLSIFQFWQENMDGDALQESILQSIAFCDLTQNGKMDLVLHFLDGGGTYLALHQEESGFYGIAFSERCFQGLQENGIYEASGGYASGSFYRLHFDEDTVLEEKLASRDQDLYYIGSKKVGEEEYAKWEENARDELVCWYTPEILKEGGDDGK